MKNELNNKDESEESQQDNRSILTNKSNSDANWLKLKENSDAFIESDNQEDDKSNSDSKIINNSDSDDSDEVSQISRDFEFKEHKLKKISNNESQKEIKPHNSSLKSLLDEYNINDMKKKIEDIENEFKNTANLIADNLGLIGENDVKSVPFISYINKTIKFLKEWVTLTPWKKYMGEDVSALDDEENESIKKILNVMSIDMRALNKSDKFSDLVKLGNKYMKNSITKSQLKSDVMKTLKSTDEKKNISIMYRIFLLLSGYDLI